MSDAGAMLIAKAVQAFADVEMMKAANFARERRDEGPAYGEEAFANVVNNLEHAIDTARNSYGWGN